MAWVPLAYGARSLVRRSASTALTVVSIGATVAVFAGVLSLQQGFARLFADHGRDDIAVLLRPGAISEGESMFDRAAVDILVKSSPEIAADARGAPLASAEGYLAVRLRKIDGGETNVPIRGVQPGTYAIRAAELKLVDGHKPGTGRNECIVGAGAARRIGARVGATIQLNTTPFEVTGVFECPGPFESEIWADADRMSAALERPYFSRVIVVLAAGATVEGLAKRLESDKRTPAKVLSERAYLGSQTQALSGTLIGLATFLAIVMGTAAVFTGTNTMLAAVAARTQEIGILLAIGFRPLPIFCSFLFEALLLGALGGVAGCAMVLPLDGIRTGTTNFNTFTEVAFAFRVTPEVLGVSVGFALLLGLIGGTIPAWKAAHLRPTHALRRG